jgi:FtsP/CotA-like multicopper oxidase with cupredoxin domain
VHVGDLVARVLNWRPDALTVHEHGVAICNDMDGVNDLTQPAITPGASFVYRFTASQPGTYFYHPHTGTQLDRGLYGALIVDGAAPSSERDVTLMLDDWTDGTGQTPDDVMNELKAGSAEPAAAPTSAWSP